MTSPSSLGLTVGSRVRVKGAYLDEALTVPVVGTVKDVFPRPDWGGQDAFVVMFDHGDPGLPPGGEFPAHRLGAEETDRP